MMMITSPTSTSRINQREREINNKTTMEIGLEDKPQFNRPGITSKSSHPQLSGEVEEGSAGDKQSRSDSHQEPVNGVRVQSNYGDYLGSAAITGYSVSINAVAQAEDDITDFEEERFYSVRGSSFVKAANGELPRNGSKGSGEEESLYCTDEDDMETVRKYEVVNSHHNHNEDYHLNPNSSILTPQSINLQFQDQTQKESKRGKGASRDDEFYRQETTLNNQHSPLRNPKTQLRTMLTSINEQRQPKLQSQLSDVSKNTKGSSSQKSNTLSSKSQKRQQNAQEIESSRSQKSSKSPKPNPQAGVPSLQDTNKGSQGKDAGNLEAATTEQELGGKNCQLHSQRRMSREIGARLEAKNISSSRSQNSNNINESLHNSSHSSSSNSKTEDGEQEKHHGIRKASIKKRKERLDIYGHVIKRGGKKHRVVFADHKQLGKPLYHIHEVESYKKYNTDMSARGSNKACCSIF